MLKKMIVRLKRFTSKEVLKELNMHNMGERGLLWDINLQIFKEYKCCGQKGGICGAAKGSKWEQMHGTNQRSIETRVSRTFGTGMCNQNAL